MDTEDGNLRIPARTLQPRSTLRGIPYLREAGCSLLGRDGGPCRVPRLARTPLNSATSSTRICGRNPGNYRFFCGSFRAVTDGIPAPGPPSPRGGFSLRVWSHLGDLCG